MTESSSDDYRRGYEAAKADLKEDLLATLMAHGVATGEEDEKLLPAEMARDIFGDVFGVAAADEAFGPKPSGAGVRAKIADRLIP